MSRTWHDDRSPGGRQGVTEHLLRRDGTLPLRFSGKLLGRLVGHPCDAGISYQLELYETISGGCVISIVPAIHNIEAGPRPLRHLVVEISSLDDALRYFEAHDPKEDLSIFFLTIY
jgi:hypothetical protein